jgi:hypothetical protein
VSDVERCAEGDCGECEACREAIEVVTVRVGPRKAPAARTVAAPPVPEAFRVGTWVRRVTGGEYICTSVRNGTIGRVIEIAGKDRPCEPGRVRIANEDPATSLGFLDPAHLEVVSLPVARAAHMRVMVARYGEAEILERTGWTREQFERAMAGDEP